MAREMTLHETQVVILSNRILLSRETKIFTIRELAASWDMAVSSIYRYDSPEYRQASRELSKYKPAEPDCHRCKNLVKGHKRCADCTILLHGKNSRCESCQIHFEEEYQELTPFV